MKLALAAVAALALVAAACGGVESELEAPSTDEIKASAESDRCSPSSGDPITVADAIKALRRHGFEITRDESGCLGGADIGKHGFLSCFVSHESAGVMVSSGTLPKRPYRRTHERNLENLTCVLYTDEDGDEPSERLEAALAELKRELGG